MSLDQLEAKDMFQVTQHRLAMSLDRCLTREDLTLRGLDQGCSRMLTYGLGGGLTPSISRSNQREDALPSSNGWLEGKQETDIRFINLPWDTFLV